MKIITNHHYRPWLTWHDLSASEQKEHADDYDDVQESTFFRYRGQVYDLGDFMYVGRDHVGWDGYHNTSFFSAVLVKYSDDGDAVKVGLALS
ncbi:MAG: hypothetical protein CMI60_06150 [Parvibaculum sp.]|nr:hypothetical protein [Parvibaculum sp.]